MYLMVDTYMLSGRSFIQPIISSSSRLLILISVLAITISVLSVSHNMLYQNLVYAQTTTTSVSWINNDSNIHTVTSGLPEKGDVGTLFDSGLISPGNTFVHVFDKQGTFDYSCTLHLFMHPARVINKLIYINERN